MIDPVEAIEIELLEILDLNKNESSVLDYQFDVIRESFSNNNLSAVNFGLLRLDYFRDNLQILETNDGLSFRKIIRDLRQAKNDDLSFYGFRFEAYVASRLVRDGVSIINRERPDFEIEEQSKIFIECGSARSRGGEESIDAFQKKISDLVGFKESKEYAAKECALFLDLTNLHYCTEPDKWQDLINNLTEIASFNRDTNLFGSILLFIQVYSQRARTITYASNRIDSPNCDPNLLQFLNTYFIHDGVSTKGPAIPREA